MIKTILKLFICITLVFPLPIYADSFMDGAKKAVRELEERSNQVVNNLILVDVTNALMQAASESIKTSEYSRSLEIFLESTVEMEKQYDIFLSNPELEYVTTRNSVRESISKYLSLYNKQMDMAWITSEAIRQRKSSVEIIKMALASLDRTCKVGKFNSEAGVSAALSQELPAYDYSFRFLKQHISTDNMFDVLGYTGLTYQHDEELLRVLYDTGQIGLAASSVLVSIGIKSGLNALVFDAFTKKAFVGGFKAATSSTTFTSTLMAATPYIVAAVIVMIVITDFVNRRKYEKLKKQRVAAEFYKFNNTQRSQWIVNEYKDRCREIIKSLNPVVKDLDFIEKNLNNPSAIFSYYKPEVEKLENEYNEWNTYALASCQKSLSDDFDRRHCVTAEEFVKIDALEYQKKNKKIPTCIYNDQVLVTQNCSLNFDESGTLNFDKAKVEATIKTYDTNIFSVQDDVNKRVNVPRYLFYKSFAQDFSKVSHDLHKRINVVLDKKRRSAFQSLLKLAGVYNQSARNQLLLSKKTEAESVLYAFEYEFQQIVSEAIAVIFEKSAPSVLKNNIIDFHDRFKEFHNNHLFMKESIELNIRVKNLTNILQLKI